MERVPVLNVEEIDAAANELAFMVALDPQSLSGITPAEALF
jgi:hypothetical protein